MRNMPCELLPWEDEADGKLLPLRKTFFNSLKESAYILTGWEGADRVTKLNLENKDNLWNSAKEANQELYQEIITNADFTSNNDVPEVVPVRILLQKGRSLISWKNDVLHLSRPLDPQLTLLKTLESIFPDIEWSRRSESCFLKTVSLDTIDAEDERVYRVRPSVQVASLEPELATSSLGWLYKTMKAPDCFLYITIKPIEGL